MEGQSYTFDDCGDLILMIGEDKISCQVCSRTMARASPVFRAMLYGGFSDSHPAEGQWEVELPEDDVHGFRIILNVIHSPWDKKAVSFEEKPDWGQISGFETRVLVPLYYALRIADKYDFLHIIKPFVDHWREVVARAIPSRAYGGIALWIGYILGDERLINVQFQKIYHEAFAGESLVECEEDTEMDREARVILRTTVGVPPVRLCEGKDGQLPLYSNCVLGGIPDEEVYQILDIVNISDQIRSARLGVLEELNDRLVRFHNEIESDEQENIPCIAPRNCPWHLARWRLLCDHFYGTDASETPPSAAAIEESPDVFYSMMGTFSPVNHGIECAFHKDSFGTLEAQWDEGYDEEPTKVIMQSEQMIHLQNQRIKLDMDDEGRSRWGVIAPQQEEGIFLVNYLKKMYPIGLNRYWATLG